MVALQGFLCGSAGKESAYNAGDLGLIPDWEDSPGEGKGYPLQCSGLENPTDSTVLYSPWTMDYAVLYSCPMSNCIMC